MVRSRAGLIPRGLAGARDAWVSRGQQGEGWGGAGQGREFGAVGGLSGEGSATLGRQACGDCGRPYASVYGLVCAGCESVFEPPAAEDVDFFALLGVERGFHIDARELEEGWRRVQWLLHPDKHSQAGAAALDRSARFSVLANQAHVTLKSPLERANYLLKAAGMGEPLGEHAKVTDPATLAHAMEVREAIEEAGDNTGRLRELLEDAEAHIAGCLREVAGCFERGDLQAAARGTHRLIYAQRAAEAIQKGLAD